MLWNSVGDAIKSKSQLASDENLVCQFSDWIFGDNMLTW